MIAIRDKEIQNSEKLIKNNQRELETLQGRYEDLREHGNIEKLQDQLEEANYEKKSLETQIKELEQEHKDQGKKLEKISNGQEY